MTRYHSLKRYQAIVDNPMIHKITTSQTLSGLLQTRQKKGERVVFTNGCFDLLHIGHIRYLQSARALGDMLVIAVNSDESVRSLGKGQGRPLTPLDQRMEVLAALTCVDYVVKFDESTPLSVIEMLQPDVLVKGGDWSVEKIVGKDIVEARGGIVKNISLTPNVSTSLIIERIQKIPAHTERPHPTERSSTSQDSSLPNPTTTA